MKRVLPLLRSRLRPYARHTRRWLLRLLRHGSYLTIAAAVLLTAVFIGARLLLPQLIEQKADIESFLSRETGYQIRIGRLETFWEGLNPGVHAHGVSLYTGGATQPALKLDDVRVSLSTLPLLIGRLRVATLIITAPRLAVERLRDGRIQVSGLEPVPAQAVDDGAALLAWLGQEGHVEIRDGELQWFDHAEPQAAVYVRDIDVRLRNRGDRHYLSVHAVLPEQMCRDCALIADVSGDLTSFETLTGEIYLRAVALDVAALPRVAREQMPTGLQGRFTTELWSDWVAGVLIGAKGSFSATDVKVPLPERKAVQLRKVSADFNMLREPDRLQVSLSRTLVQADKDGWQAGSIRYDQRGEALALRVSHVNLAAITHFLAAQAFDHDVARRWVKLSPSGAIDDVRLTIEGPIGAPREFSFKGELAEVGVQAHGSMPAVSGLSGALAFHRHGGTLQLSSRALVLSLPKIFRGPFPAAQASADIHWERTDSHWVVASEALKLTNPDLRAEAKLRLRLPFDEASSPVVDLQAVLHDVDGSQAKRYFPAHTLERDTLAWMDSSFVGGRVTQARIVLQGPLREFPFDQGGGRFEIDGHVVDGVYEYLGGWLPVTEANMHLLIRGREVVVAGRGRIGALRAEHVVVQTATRPAADGTPQRLVEVSTEIAGPVAEALRVLHAVKAKDPAHSWKRNFPSDLRGSGGGWLGLRVTIPVESVKDSHFRAHYRFEGSELGLETLGLAVHSLQGEVRFTGEGPQSGTVRGVALDGPLELRFTPQGSDVLAEIDAKTLGSGLAAWLGPSFRDRIDGELVWRARWQAHEGLASLRVEAPTLKNLNLRLPAPLDYAEGLPDTRLAAHLAQHRSGHMEIIAQAGQLLAARLLLARGTGELALPRGEVSIGDATARLTDREGVQYNVRGQRLDLDGWLAIAAGAATRAVAPGPAGFRGQFNTVRLFDREFGRLAVGLLRRGGTWSGRLAGEQVIGELRVDRQGKNARIGLNLSQLILPKSPRKVKKPTAAPTDPRRLPIVSVKATRLVYGEAEYGTLDLFGQPMADGWKLAHLKLHRPEADVSINGSWRVLNGGERSDYQLSVKSSDVTKTSEALKARSPISGGTLEVSADVRWPGSLGEFDMRRANGRLKVRADNGSLRDIQEGATRMFGVLDVSSLFRYMALDFKPLVEEGFLYKSLKFHATLENGNLFTDDFYIKGRSADVKTSGRVGIAAQDLDLVMEVSPHIGGGAALASWWLWGPQAGAIALAIQQIFKTTGAGVRVIYEVKGPWDKPKVTRVVSDEQKKRQQPVPDQSPAGAD